MFTKLLLACDGSEMSNKVIAAGLPLAQALKAQIVLIRVVEPYPLQYIEGALSMAPFDVSKVEAIAMNTAEKEMKLIEDKVIAAGLKVKTYTVQTSWIAETIIRTAKEQECDLIVMASHGYKAVKRLLLGSQTQNVLTHTSIPVLIVR